MAGAAFDVDARWQLSPSVALRPEPFGALAYHFGNRRLTFLKSLQMVDLVRSLEQHGSAGAAITALGVKPADRPSYERALASLADSHVVVRVKGAPCS